MKSYYSLFIVLLSIVSFTTNGFAKEPANRKSEIKKDYKEAVAKASKYSSMGQIQLAEASYKKALKFKKELNLIEKKENEMKEKLAALKSDSKAKKSERKVASVKKAKNKFKKPKDQETLSAVVGADNMPTSAPPSASTEGDPETFAADAGLE